MKKIISRYYFFIAVLLVIVYQYFSGLVLNNDFTAGLSKFGYYFSDMMLKFLVVLLALVAMIWSGKWQQINNRKFKRVLSFLFFFSFSCIIYLEFCYIFPIPTYPKWTCLPTRCSDFYRSYGIFDVFFLSCDCRSHF